jgi:hypothetical protein
MSPPKATVARQAGIFYLLMGIPAVFTLQYLPRAFFVPGDAAATAHKITESVLTYRLLVLCDLASPIFFLFLVWCLYHLLADVDKRQARLMVMLVLVSVAIGIVDVIFLAAPLILASGADFLSVFTKPQVDALAFGFLRLRSVLLQADEAFWGLWLLPFGILVIRSGFIPKFIGAFLILGCFAYLAMTFTSIVFPAQARLVSQVGLPLAAPGELFMLIWLFVKGTKLQSSEAQLAYAS